MSETSSDTGSAHALVRGSLSRTVIGLSSVSLNLLLRLWNLVEGHFSQWYHHWPQSHILELGDEGNLSDWLIGESRGR